METTRCQIQDAQSHVNRLIASYHRDMNVLRIHFMSLYYDIDEGQPSSWHEDVNKGDAPFDTNNTQQSLVHSSGQRTSVEGDI